MSRIGFTIAKGLKILLNPPALRRCAVDKTARVCARSELTECTVGRYSYVGYQCFLARTRIGAFCSIAGLASIGCARHPMEFVSGSPVFHEGNNILKKNFSAHKVEETPWTVIGNDVWIGRGAFIKAGVHISTGAVIGMGAVVTRDVGPYEIWAGNPAGLLRRRFDGELIARLLASRWWELNDRELSQYAQYFNHPEEFLQKLEENRSR